MFSLNSELLATNLEFSHHLPLHAASFQFLSTLSLFILPPCLISAPPPFQSHSSSFATEQQIPKLKAENERLKSENRALTRVVAKLTAAGSVPKISSTSSSSGEGSIDRSRDSGVAAKATLFFERRPSSRACLLGVFSFLTRTPLEKLAVPNAVHTWGKWSDKVQSAFFPVFRRQM